MAGVIAAVAWPTKSLESLPPGTVVYSVSGALTPREVRLLMDGTHPEGAAPLGRWLTLRTEGRRVVSRANPGRHEVLIDVRALPVEGWRLATTVEVSVDGEDWRPLDRDAPVLLTEMRGPFGTTAVVVEDVAALLGESIRRPSVVLRQRVTVRLLPAGTGPSSGVRTETLATAPAGGTTFTWPEEVRSLIVYDDYPDDYPEIVRDPALAEAMRAGVAPSSAFYGGLQALEGGQGVRLYVVFDKPESPVGFAGVVDWLAADGTVLASAWWVRHAGPPELAGRPVTQSGYSLPFRLKGANPAAESRFLLDLEADRIREVRLLFRPSREVALHSTQFDRYWGDPIEARIPLHRGEPRLGLAPTSQTDAR